MKIYNYNEIDESFFSKIEFENISSVQEVISSVRKNGDVAIREYSKKFGDGDVENFKLSREEINEALKQVDEETVNTIKYAIKNIRK